jgi:hypothetical protein
VGGGIGRRIVANAGAVEIVDAAAPADPPDPDNPNGRLRTTGNVEVGALGRPEIDLDPNHYGNGPEIRMGQAVWANDAPHGPTAFIKARSTGAPLFRNYNLRLQTESADGGGSVGWVVVRGGDGLISGLGVHGGPVYLQGGSGLDPAGGDGGDIFILPGGSVGGAPGFIVLANPTGGTGAALTATGPFVGGVTGTIRFATDMGGISVDILAGDNLVTVLAKINATLQVIATQLAGVITLTTASLGPTAEVFFLNDTVGNALDTALGVFAGQVAAPGAWPLTVNVQVTAPNEISFGVGGAAGPLIYNADTGKLTLPGVLDPTATVYSFAPPPTVTPLQGGLFVSDGSGGLSVGALYYRTPGGAANINLSGGATGTITIQQGGLPINPTTNIINFLGAGVTAVATGPTSVDVTIPGGAGAGAKVWQEVWPDVSFIFGAGVSVVPLAKVPDMTATIIGLFVLFCNGNADMDNVTPAVPATAKQYRINLGNLEIGTNIIGTANVYRLVYPTT